MTRAARLLRPSHQHTAFSATVLLMAAIMLSRIIGYVREAYIAWAFGAGVHTDAYVAAFTLPDWLNYLVAGGTASITFVSIFTRYVSQKREDEAEKAFSIIITVMSTALLIGVALAEVFTPQFTRLLFPRFTAEQHQLCVYLTRILLPAQVFFYVGGVVSAVLLSRRQFLFPALGPVLYSLFIILGGVLLKDQLGIASLAVGAVAGSFAGPFLINAFGAARTGIRFRPSFDISHPAFREWVTLSIPLMLGVSLVTADEWILRYFASGGVGDITRLSYAKRLFAVPIAVLGQAAGQASLPFFAKLFGENRREEFARMVNTSVYRAAALGMLASAWMAANALPVVDLVYRRGRFQFSDSQDTALYFFWFALSLAAWVAQSLYSRGFYAAGDTMSPMLASTVITVASLWVYAAMFRQLGVQGLAIASGIGIVVNTLTMALLLDRKRLVPLRGMNWPGLAKALLAAVLSGAAAWYASRFVHVTGGRREDLLAIAAATVAWAVVGVGVLWITRSDLPGLVLARNGFSPAQVARDESREMQKP